MLESIIVDGIAGVVIFLLTGLLVLVYKKIPWRRLSDHIKSISYRFHNRINHLKGIYSIQDIIQFSKLPEEKLSKRKKAALERERETLNKLYGGPREEVFTKMEEFQKACDESKNFRIQEMQKEIINNLRQ